MIMSMAPQQIAVDNISNVTLAQARHAYMCMEE